MIIWGSRGRKKTVSTGEFYCPSENATRPYAHKRVARYFTLYFIPLFKTKDLGEYVECGSCQGTFKPEVLSYTPPSPAERMLAGVRRDLESGTPVGVVQGKLLNAGMARADAEAVVNAALAGNRVFCAQCGAAYLASVQTCTSCGNQLRPRRDA